jgi:hypothetical protein
MTLSMFVKKKFDFRYVQIWLWVCLLKKDLILNNVEIWLWICLSKEKLTLDISKYDFKYV